MDTKNGSMNLMQTQADQWNTALIISTRKRGSPATLRNLENSAFKVNPIFCRRTVPITTNITHSEMITATMKNYSFNRIITLALAFRRLLRIAPWWQNLFSHFFTLSSLPQELFERKKKIILNRRCKPDYLFDRGKYRWIVGDEKSFMI